MCESASAAFATSISSRTSGSVTFVERLERVRRIRRILGLDRRGEDRQIDGVLKQSATRVVFGAGFGRVLDDRGRRGGCGLPDDVFRAGAILGSDSRSAVMARVYLRHPVLTSAVGVAEGVDNRDPPCMTIEAIRHSEDPRLEDFRDLQGRDQRGIDARPGVFIGEQPLVVEAMLESPERIRRILVAEGKRSWLEKTLAAHGAPEVEALVAPKEILESIVGFQIHRGVLASGDRAGLDDRNMDEIIPHSDRPSTILVCESIRNIDNIGMLFRVAAAFGVDGVILSPDCHDPLYRKSLRVSIGHALRIPFARSTNWAEDLARLGTAHGFHRIGASIDGRRPKSTSRPRSTGSRW